MGISDSIVKIDASRFLAETLHTTFSCMLRVCRVTNSLLKYYFGEVNIEIWFQRQHYLTSACVLLAVMVVV